MTDIRTTPGGGMEAIGHSGSWQTVPKAAQDEIERLRAQVADLRGENAVLCQADGCGMPGPCMARNCQHPWSSASDTQEIE